MLAMRVETYSINPCGFTMLMSTMFKIIIVETTLVIPSSFIVSTFIKWTLNLVSIWKFGIRAPPMIT